MVRSIVNRTVFQVKDFFGKTSPLEKILQLPIYDEEFFRQAITHSNKNSDNYERLEFLGDSILDAIISEKLFKEEQIEEGKMTVLRSKYVSRESLCLFGSEIGLQNVIISDSLDLSLPQNQNHRIIGDVMEALIGAIYLKYGYDSTRDFIEQVLLSKTEIVTKIRSEIKNYKGLLLERSQQENFSVNFKFAPYNGQLYYATAIINGKSIATGRGSTKKKAEQRASKYLMTNPDLITSILAEEVAE